jgi:biotin transport system ATP-binding protein
MDNIVEIRGLSHVFPDGTTSLKNIDLEIRRGSFVVIAGCNGSGKTTLLRHLNGLLRAQTGEVRVDGRPVADNLLETRQKVGMVFQESDSQIVGETVCEDVAFGPENLRLPRQEIDRRVEAALVSVGLSSRGEARPHQLSGGQKRRLTIAGILAMQPLVLVFDEPFSNLDYPGFIKVLQNILSLHREGHTIILTTHELEKVIVHADRLLIMQGGQILRDDLPHKLFKELESFGVREPCASRLNLVLESWLT